jgi:hypothetical protein
VNGMQGASRFLIELRKLLCYNEEGKMGLEV